MKFHVIGNKGNMGKRYTKILKDLGYEVSGNNKDENVDMNASHYLVCTPPSDHVMEALPHLMNGKRVMIEKPIALTLEDAKLLKPYKPLIWHVVNFWDWDLSDVKHAHLYYGNTYPKHCTPHYLDLIHYVAVFKKNNIEGHIEMDFMNPDREVFIKTGNRKLEEPFSYTECLERNLNHFIAGETNYDNAVESLEAIINPKSVEVSI